MESVILPLVKKFERPNRPIFLRPQRGCVHLDAIQFLEKGEESLFHPFGYRVDVKDAFQHIHRLFGDRVQAARQVR